MSENGGPIHDRRRQIVAELLLVAVTAVWGWTFVMVKDAVALLPPLPFIAIRFGLATIVVALGLSISRRWSTAARRSASGHGHQAAHAAAIGITAAHGDPATRAAGSAGVRGAVRAGAIMGVFLGAGYIFQTFGLQRTTPSNAGFITGMFVVLVPVMQGVVWRTWPDRRAVVGVALAAFGLFLLSGGSSGLNFLGDGLVFLCALSFAAHILATSRYARHHDAAVLTVVQLGVVALLSGALSVVGWAMGYPLDLGGVWDPTVLLALGVTALFASAAAFYIQTFAQRYASPTRTAVILTMEPVFAGVFGYTLAGDRLSPVAWLGAAAILCGMLASEFRTPGRRRREGASM